jgi:hypothetical protein
MADQTTSYNEGALVVRAPAEADRIRTTEARMRLEGFGSAEFHSFPACELVGAFTTLDLHTRRDVPLEVDAYTHGRPHGHKFVAVSLARRVTLYFSVEQAEQLMHALAEALTARVAS